MKEAAGQANITVITITLIGVVIAVSSVIIPRILDNVQKKAICNERMGKVIRSNICEYETTELDGKTVHQRRMEKCPNGSWDFEGECE
jgi:hypothetical protein